MISRLLVLALAVAPASKLTDWVNSDAGDARTLTFKDKAGDHAVKFQISRLKSKVVDDAELKSQQLVVVHTVGKKEVWRAKDFVEKCEFDLALDVIDDSIEVTDLDVDGEAEVSFLYRTGCRSDVSPLTVKLLMYEGTTKYALRGESRERVGEAEWAGGTYKVDVAFQKAPDMFLPFAKAKWDRLVNVAR